MKFFAKLGPGLLIAATAVGVSHLVQSTRAGADFGLSMGWLIIAIVILKYPAFRFATEYAAVTGKSLVRAYSSMGKFALGWLIFAMLIEMIVGTSAVSMVVAGILLEVTGFNIAVSLGAIIVVTLTAAVLYNGSYSRFERFVKAFVVGFSVLVLAATLIALPQLASSEQTVFPEITWSHGVILFAIAMTGWMPLPVAVTAFQSVWVREKVIASKGEYDRVAAVKDLSVGWILTTVLALCFLAMGTAILYVGSMVFPNDSVGFTTTLFSVFTGLAGEWTYPLFALGGLAVVWSTLVAIMDAVPRLMDRIIREVAGEERCAQWSPQQFYRMILGGIIVSVSIVMLVFVSDFSSFIDFAASASFIVAPAIAYFNHRAVMSADVSEIYQPGRLLVVWSWVSIAAFTLFAITFFYLRFVA